MLHPATTTMSMTVRKDPLNEQEMLVMRLRGEEGLSYLVIAGQMGVSHHRVRQIYRMAKARLHDFAVNGEDSLSPLPPRVAGFLEWNKIGTSALARKAILSGALDWVGGHLTYHGRAVRGCGWKSWTVLHEWVGLPRPKADRVVICPHCGGSIEA